MEATKLTMAKNEFPLLNEILSLWKVDNTIWLEVLGCPKKQPYLKSHIFGGAPIMPGAAMIELCAEAAAVGGRELGVHNLPLVSIEEFRIQRAIKFPLFTPKILRISVESDGTSRHDQFRLRVTITSDSVNSDGKVIRKNVCHCTAHVFFGKHLGKLKNGLPELPADSEHIRIHNPSIYETFIRTHGFLLSSLTGRFSTYNFGKCILGQFEMGDKQRFFTEMENNKFILSILAMDSAFQVQVMNVIMSGLQERVPIGGYKMCFYQPPEELGTHYALIEELNSDENVTTSKVTVFKSDGSVCFQFEGFQFQRNGFNEWKEFQYRQRTKEEFKELYWSESDVFSNTSRNI